MESESVLKKRKSMASYSVTLKNNIRTRWAGLARAARDRIEITDLGKKDKYNVKAVLMNSDDEMVAIGHYDGSNNRHAEIGAFENCRHPGQDMSLSVNPPPCKRCAVVVRIYMRKYDITLKAPKKKFASTYSGGYDITKKIADLIIQDLIDSGVITAEQSEHYRDEIITDFQAGDWVNSV